MTWPVQMDYNEFHCPIDGNQQYTLSVQELATGLSKPCDFPFKHNGYIYSQCAKDTSFDGFFWCSTKKNENTLEHISGHGFWGICKDEEERLSQGMNICKKS